jgi:excisionase family DNA binding protein
LKKRVKNERRVKVMVLYYSISEVAEMMNLNYYTILYWCRDGKLPVVYINKTYRIPIIALIAEGI